MGIELLELAREKRKQSIPTEEIVTIQPCMPSLLLTASTIKDAIVNHATHGRTVLLAGYGMLLNGGSITNVFVAVRKMGPIRYEVVAGVGCPYGQLSNIVEQVKDFTVCTNWDAAEIERLKESREHLGGD